MSDENCGIQENVIENDDLRVYLRPGGLHLYNYAWAVTGICAVMATTISMWLVKKHLQHYTNPNVQRHIIRILLMVPVYAIDSFFSFRFYWLSVYFDVFRDSYEAFVIYEFFTLLVAFFGGYESGKEFFEEQPAFKLPFPFCKVVVKPSRGFLRICKRLTLQYVFIRPTTAFMAVLLHSEKLFCPGNMSPSRGYFWHLGMNFISVTVSMYALVMFYMVAKEYLRPYQVILKFISVKFVILLSFWQSIIVSFLVQIDFIRSTASWSTDNIATGVQNALICIEMALVAIMHIYAYDYQDYIPKSTVEAAQAAGMKPRNYPSTTYVFSSMRDALNMKDVWRDFIESFFGVRSMGIVQSKSLHFMRSLGEIEIKTKKKSEKNKEGDDRHEKARPSLEIALEGLGATSVSSTFDGPAPVSPSPSLNSQRELLATQSNEITQATDRSDTNSESGEIHLDVEGDHVGEDDLMPYKGGKSKTKNGGKKGGVGVLCGGDIDDIFVPIKKEKQRPADNA